VAPDGNWTVLAPLLLLLALLAGAVAVLYLLFGVRVIGLVMLIVPVLSLGWAALQQLGHGAFRHAWSFTADYVARELPAYRSELVLLMMAGYIGTVGSRLLAPLMTAAGIDMLAVPPWLIIISFVWLIPVAGQLGMNPILVVSLVAPSIPDAAQLGVTPTALAVAITAGWALSGASSPYTATTLLIGSFAGMPAWQVGWYWNPGFTAVAGLLLTCWALLFAFIL
jgi:hypothetical protein